MLFLNMYADTEKIKNFVNKKKYTQLFRKKFQLV